MMPMGKGFFCATPFVNMVGRPNGDVGLCCLLPDFVVGNINKKSLIEIWNSSSAQALREEFLTGEIKTCRSNILARGCNRWDDALLEYVEYRKEQAKPPQKIDLRLNGFCNLECIMCNAWSEENGVYTAENFWHHAEEKIFPYIKEIKVLGGEPFIQRDFFKLVDRVTKINPDCSWSIWTNGAWHFSSFYRRLLDRIDNIKMLTISFDSPVKKTFEYIRKKADFDTILRTIEDLIRYRNYRPKEKTFFIQLDLVIQKANMWEVEEYIKLARRFGVFPGFFFLFNPRNYSILQCSVVERIQLLKWYLELMEIYDNPKMLVAIKPLLKSLSAKEKKSFRLYYPSLKRFEQSEPAHWLNL